MFRPMLLAVRQGALLPRLSICSRRQFGSTSPAWAVRALFSKTDSEELDKILKNIQENIIFPAYLPPQKRKLVFDPTKKDELEVNPVIIEVEDQKYRFPSLDAKKIPNAIDILLDAIENMKTPRDWDNLATLLAGYQKADINIRNNYYGKLGRMAAKSGNMQAIIECAKQWKDTGLSLKNRELVHRIFASNNERIYENNNDKQKALQAHAQNMMLLDLLHRPEHATAESSLLPPVQSTPLVRGLYLYAYCSAIKAKQLDGKDVEKDMDLLREELKMFTSVWNEAALSDIGSVPEIKRMYPSGTRKNRRSPGLNGYAFLQVLSMVARASELAAELVGGDGRYLNVVSDAIVAYVAEYARVAWGRDETWDDEYEKIMGRRPEWPEFDRDAALEKKKTVKSAAESAAESAAKSASESASESAAESTAESAAESDKALPEAEGEDKSKQ